MQVALACAPVLHRSLALVHRCETALTGFIAIDLFRQVADGLCQARRLPKGSLFMAGQTSSTLQLCALTTAIMCITKHETWNPWSGGHGRASELSVEQHLGCCRQQSPNSQLSARGYWLASARQTFRMAKVLAKQVSVTKNVPPLTPEQFLGIDL